MDFNDTNTPNSSPFSHSFPTIYTSFPPQPIAPTQVVMNPCAACKILRRRCAEKCVLAPYFPPNEPAKFTFAHKVFGASNIIKFLQELPESQRADAVTSMVYEAGARIRDPIYGCAGVICNLQKQINQLQTQLAKTQAEVVNMQLQQANLVALICMQMAPQQSLDNFISSTQYNNIGYQNNLNFYEENISLNSLLEPLWT
ncbi:PREDICTED: LOB domain-containing protein 1-like [Lupinus angustifolius]|uniref:LOB domain-containing protein 1-like n=1 Tax=Lupinus angustifolius TaxID=3871 RepID=UPI00092F6570|nr:PREDICTED: LOB domain-containing protein 1-like [Lupinus angustifolius]